MSDPEAGQPEPKLAFQTDGEFWTGEAVLAYPSPLQVDVWHLPGGCTFDMPPELAPGDRARRNWEADTWEIVPAEPEPEAPPPILLPISDRQFAQQLAIDGVITEAEALAWAARGDLPAALEAAIGALPEGDRFSARMLLSAAVSYHREHALVGELGPLMGYDAAALDALWSAAAAL